MFDFNAIEPNLPFFSFSFFEMMQGFKSYKDAIGDKIVKHEGMLLEIR